MRKLAMLACVAIAAVVLPTASNGAAPAGGTVSPTATGSFTSTAIHEASHFLGLAHPHDTIGAVRDPDGSPHYWDGLTWTFDSTKAVTTYAHDELTYGVLDQEDIARGHSAYYVKWTNEALAEAGG